MPKVTIDVPEGAAPTAKRKMLAAVSEAVGQAYRIPDIRVWLREYSAGHVSQDGRIDAEPVRPACGLEAPELDDLDVKRTLVRAICSAIADAYRGIANTDETVVLIHQFAAGNEGINQVFSARS